MTKDSAPFKIHLTPGEKVARGLCILVLLICISAKAFSQDLPKSIEIKESPEIKLIQAQLEILSLRQKILELEFRERLMTQLRLSGIADKDFQRYQFNADTLTFTLKEKQ